MINKQHRQEHSKTIWQNEKYGYGHWIVISLLVLILAGCEAVPQGKSSGDVSAIWSDETSTLKISGKAEANEESIEIHDAADGSLLGMALVDGDGNWSAISTTPACEVHVTLAEGKTTFAVKNSPNDCTSSASYARAVKNGGKITSAADIPVNVLVVDNPVALNNVPNAVILNPPQNLSVTAGQIVNFEGVAIGTGIQPPFSYFWNFGGAAPNSSIQNPGSVRFDIPGTYFIQLSVSDNLGIPDPTPAVRTITVSSPNSPAAVTPVPSIVAPSPVNGTVSINVGESLFFAGTAIDNIGSTSFTYEWNFSGIYPTQFGATAGSIPFNQAGTFLVSLYATNIQGIRSATPATVVVMVNAASGVNQAPTGIITRPRNDVTINAGESLVFRGRGQDPDNTLPLFYSWDFAGAAPNINLSTDNSAGSITFNTPGIYNIRLSVTDAQSATDPNPPTRIVTVLSTTTPPPGNGILSTQILSPATDLTIAPGQSVFFSGQASSPNNVPLQYYWNFGGAAVDSNLLTPGGITFPTPGQYFVSFFAIDNTGNIIGAPTSRTITVSDPSNVVTSITSPADNSTFTVGQSVSLIGDVGNTTGFSNLTYKWGIRIKGVNATRVFTSSQLSPGNYVFTQPGDYVVKFEVSGTDQFGNVTVANLSKSRVTVTGTPVPGTTPGTNPGTGPVTASTGILSPASDMVIYTGNTIDFEASTIIGNGLSYIWDFGGAASSSTRQNPRPVTFNVPGAYYITLRVTGTANGVPINVFDQRIITVLQQNSSFPPAPVPGTTSTGIQSPISDQVINVGGSVNFEANTVIGNNIRYTWDFGGARGQSRQRNPRAVTFNTPGSYLVTLMVTGTATNGLPINNFDQRYITVLQSTAPIPPGPNPVPFATGITSPASDMVINVGNSVNFEAINIAGANLTYSWNFGTARSPSSRRNPRPVQFNNPGSYLVSVQISGTVNGQPFNTFDQRLITVLQTSSPSPIPTPVPPIVGTSLPEGIIVQPSQSVVSVRVGQPLQFMGNGFDPVGFGSLTFQWSFGGAQRNIIAQNPGAISFNRVGTYVVSLLVQNAVGQFDSTPPTVVVMVTP